MDIQWLMVVIITNLFWLLLIFFMYTKWKWKKKELIENYNRFLHLVENSTDFIYFVEVYPEIKYMYLSRSAEKYFGEGSIERAYINPEIPLKGVHPDDYPLLIRKLKGDVDYSKAIIQRWKDKNGNYRWFEEYATPIYENGVLVALQGALRNIDDRVELQAELDYRLYHDTLTKVYNREYFELIYRKYDEIKDSSVGIILCDLDELKYINDTFGHKAGDNLIQQIACLLQAFSTDSVMVARIGGDEFVLVVAEKSEHEIIRLVNKIRNEVDRFNQFAQYSMIKVSIGYAFTSHSYGEMAHLFTKADKEMYAEKMKRKQVMSY